MLCIYWSISGPGIQFRYYAVIAFNACGGFFVLAFFLGGGGGSFFFVVVGFPVCLRVMTVEAMQSNIFKLTRRDGRVGRAQPSRAEGREFESQVS